MNAKMLVEGLKANYPESTHPTKIMQDDMLRVLKNMGYTDNQLTMLYDELLRSCQFFPKVFDIHQAVAKLKLIRPGTKSEANRTREMLDKFKSQEQGMTFKEWLESGGRQTIWEDCGYDEAKYRKRMALLGVMIYPVPEKPKENKSDFEFITDELPSFDDSFGVEVEYVTEPMTIDEL